MVASFGNLCCPWRPWSSFLYPQGQNERYLCYSYCIPICLVAGYCNCHLPWHPLPPPGALSRLRPTRDTQASHRPFTYIAAGQSSPPLAISVSSGGLWSSFLRPRGQNEGWYPGNSYCIPAPIYLVAGQSPPALASSATPRALPRLLRGQARDSQASHRPLILLLANGRLLWQPPMPLAPLEL